MFSGYVAAGQSQMDALGWQVGHDSCCFKPWLTSLVRSIIRMGWINLFPSLVPCRLGPSERVDLCYGVGAAQWSSLPGQEEWQERGWDKAEVSEEGRTAMGWWSKSSCSSEHLSWKSQQLRLVHKDQSSPALPASCILQHLITSLFWSTGVCFSLGVYT